jgi:hypothetical protein
MRLTLNVRVHAIRGRITFRGILKENRSKFDRSLTGIQNPGPETTHHDQQWQFHPFYRLKKKK